jgi:hypothetical protein
MLRWAVGAAASIANWLRLHTDTSIEQHNIPQSYHAHHHMICMAWAPAYLLPAAALDDSLAPYQAPPCNAVSAKDMAEALCATGDPPRLLFHTAAVGGRRCILFTILCKARLHLSAASRPSHCLYPPILHLLAASGLLHCLQAYCLQAYHLQATRLQANSMQPNLHCSRQQQLTPVRYRLLQQDITSWLVRPLPLLPWPQPGMSLTQG